MANMMTSVTSEDRPGRTPSLMIAETEPQSVVTRRIESPALRLL